MAARSATAPQTTKESVPVRQDNGNLLTEFDGVWDSIARRAFELFESGGRWRNAILEDWFRAVLETSPEPRCLKISGKCKTRAEETIRKTASRKPRRQSPCASNLKLLEACWQ